jgi:hypothetical protein
MSDDHKVYQQPDYDGTDDTRDNCHPKWPSHGIKKIGDYKGIEHRHSTLRKIRYVGSPEYNDYA